MEKKENYTVSIYTENNIGLLNRISAIFLKRHINIDTINSSPSEIEQIYRFVIVVKVSESDIKKIITQIEMQIEVIAAFFHTDQETIFQESALYKVKSKSLFEERHIQNIIKNSHAKIVTVSPEFFVIEKTGFREETEKLYKDLAPYGLLQFVRSVLEGMLSGVPVVTSNLTSIPEVGGDSVIYVDPFNEDSISMGMEKAMGNNQELIKKALLQAEKFSWDTSALKVKDLLLNAMNKNFS